MTVDEAVRDLLAVSTDIRQVMVIDHGVVLGAAPVGDDRTAVAPVGDDRTAVAPGRDDMRVVAAVDGLWQMAALTARLERAADGGAHLESVTDCGAVLEHVVVDLGDAKLIVLEGGGRHIVALTAPDPALGLALFDLRTCLADAFPDETASGEPG